MTSSYNLVDEPWIPCITLDGQYLELGLRDTLARASDLREIRDSSPLVTAALHRLLLAILQRCFGPESDDAWLALWRVGKFDFSVLDSYFLKWQQRFDLFEADRPFYQNTEEEVREAKTHPIAALAHELASGNNATLFDHSVSDAPRPVEPATAARLLVATQNYAMGGGISFVGGNKFNLRHAPLVGGVWVLHVGRNLLETLLLNMLVISEDEPVPATGMDAPTWERDVPPKAGERLSDGYLDYLTWQSRRVILEREEGGKVASVHVLQGDALQSEGFFDPMMVLICRDPSKGFLPLKFRQDRAMWRDSYALFSSQIESVRRPLTVEQLARIQESGRLAGLEGATVHLFGVCSDQAKVNFWRHEQFPLPTRYVKDDALVGDLQHALNYAEEAGKALWAAIRNLATNLLVPLDELDRKPDRDMVSQLAGSLSCEGHFWAALEAAFYRMFIALAEEPEHADEAIAEWRKTILQTARSVFGLSARGHEESARGLRAIAKAQRKLNADLNRVLEFEREEVNTHA